MKNRNLKIPFRDFAIILSLSLSIILLIPLAANAQFNYVTNGNTITITGYNGPGGNVTIPDSIEGLPVTAIGDDVFQFSGITTIVIPNSVISIGETAFSQSSLTSVTIPDSVINLGAAAFVNCGSLTNVTIGNRVSSLEGTFGSCYRLTSVTIPDSVTNIDGAFNGCSSLTNVTIPDSVTSIDGAFQGCSSLTGVTIPDSVTSIGEYTFYQCGLGAISIPDSVTSIGVDAFYLSGLGSVSIPSSVTNIGSSAFGYCLGLQSFYFQGNAPPDNGIFFCSPCLDEWSPTAVYCYAGATGFGPTFSGVPVVVIGPASTPPSIAIQPQDTSADAYGSASFSVAIAGTLPAYYQWCLNGTNLPNSGSLTFDFTNTLYLDSVEQSDLGSYSVVITNAFGSITSSNAVLSMYPFLETPFAGVVTDWGYTNTLSVDAWGTGLSYQWYDNGAAVLNATNATLTLAPIQFTNAGLYSVVVSNDLGSVTNTPEQVVVNPAGVSIGMYPGVTVSGVVGYTYLIQSGADLTNTNGWSTVATLTLQEPVELWVDTNVNASLPTNAYRFYRVLPGQ